jgi:hypothetical protein
VVDPPVEVATAERAALEWGEPLLQPGDPLIGRQAVLHETQRATGSRHPDDLSQRPGLVRNHAQGPGAQHAVDARAADERA